MDTISVVRRTALGLTGAMAALALMLSQAHAGVAVHGADETLSRFCRQEAGKLWFVLPSGSRYELVTSTADPAIANPGDGQFHPFDDTEVSRALSEVRYPLGSIAVDVFVLPYPRREVLQSAAGPGVIVLAPGVRPIAAEVQPSVVAHELGHVVHRALMPDADLETWSRYRSMRGIADETVFHPAAIHANRPNEIFAEDFRALFGGSLANYSGTIENSALTPPGQVAGLDDFMVGLSVQPLASGGILRAVPNPSRDALRVEWAGADPSPVEVFDASGRRIRTVPAVAHNGGWTAAWDGRDEGGRRVPPAICYARVRGSRAAPITVVRVR